MIGRVDKEYAAESQHQNKFPRLLSMNEYEETVDRLGSVQVRQHCKWGNVVVMNYDILTGYQVQVPGAVGVKLKLDKRVSHINRSEKKGRTSNG